jgi:hypothetical protein
MAGNAGIPEYFHKLEKIENWAKKVIYLGDVRGELKWSLIKKAQVLVLPSHSENFGNVVLEALSVGTPVIASKGTPWKILETKNAGMWINCNSVNLREALNSVSTEPALWSLRGKNALDVAKGFTWESVAKVLCDRYRACSLSSRERVRSLRYQVQWTINSGNGVKNTLHISQPSPSLITGSEWYQIFRERALASIGKTWFPVYRMADGEFSFCVGWRPPYGNSVRSMTRRIAWKLGLYNLTDHATCWNEKYTMNERAALMPQYIANLKKISKHGCLAMFLGKCENTNFDQYKKEICSWLGNNQIELTINNYLPFFSVLHFLTSQGWQELYCGKRILIVTSIESKGQQTIHHRLKEWGVKSVQFLTIYPHKSLTENINIADIGEVDIALVGAGIGSANILCQLEPLQTLCLDVGAYINALEDPKFLPHGAFIIRNPLP